MAETKTITDVEIFTGDTIETASPRSCDYCGATVVERGDIRFVCVEPDGLSVCDLCFVEVDL